MENSTLYPVTEAIYKPQVGIVDDRSYNIIEQFVIVTGTLFTFTGMITNSINIRTFFAVGTDDAVVVSFLALSVNDLIYSASCFVASIGILCRQLELHLGYRYSVSPFVLLMFPANVAATMYSYTELTTTFLAVVRCLCVARPLQFKNLITKRRAIYAQVFFAVFTIALHVPILSHMGTITMTDPRTNRTRVNMWISDRREGIKDIVFFLFDIVIGSINQVLLIVSIFVMARSLRKSIKFRSISKSGNSKQEADSSGKLSGKELQVVQQVILISTIFVICALSDMVTAIYSLADTEYDVGKREHNLYFALDFLNSVTETFNSCSTMFIYLKYNSKFRANFMGMKRNEKS